MGGNQLVVFEVLRQTEFLRQAPLVRKKQRQVPPETRRR